MIEIRRWSALLGPSLALALAAAAAPASAQDTSRVVMEYWPEINVFVRLGNEARLLFLAQPSAEVENGQRSEYYDIQAGPFLEIGLRPLIPSRAARSRADGSRMKYLRLRSGVEYQGMPGAANEEWRIVSELIPRFHLPGDVLLAWRNRMELRWIGGDFSWRYRSRLKAEGEIHPGPLRLIPYGSAEIFWDSRKDEFGRLRCQFGTSLGVAPWFEPEVNYTYQQDRMSGPDMMTHALNVVAVFYF